MMTNEIDIPATVQMADTAPISDLECEKMVLSSLISSVQNIVEIEEVLDTECFYDLHHKEIYSAILNVYHKGDRPDLVSIKAELAAMGSEVKVQELGDILVNNMAPLDIYPRSQRLRELGMRRKLWDIGMMLIGRSCQESEDLESVHLDAKNSIDSLFQGIEDETVNMADSYKELQTQMLLNRDLQEGQTIGTPTGFLELDRNGGLNETDLVVVGAETSQGKTSFATALTMSAIEAGDGVAFYSMEMTPKQLTARIASMRSGINVSDILYHKLEMWQIYKIDEAMSGFDASLLKFDGRSTSSLESILLSIRMMVMKHGIKGAVIDYLQLMSIKSEKLPREQMIAKCARDLKNLAKDLKIWIIVISQLSREKVSGLPTMSRLRDSGQIEEAADNVYLIYRPGMKGSYPDPFKDVPTDGTAEVIIGKGRNTGTGEFICGFKGENTLFYPLGMDEIERMKTRYSFPPADPTEEKLPF